METPQPYLSVVVTARNDDHGGNLLGRMQIFVNGWLAQARRHHVPSELIIVEWNPPADRPRLKEALDWPEDLEPCEVRFIEVPPELHQRYRHAKALPLYQMIAKNVGIRRAQGRFILATNIDILFSDELMAFLGAQRLEADRMYRIDRYDVDRNVPLHAGIEEQLAYCRTHLLRINAREGTFPLRPDGRRVLAREDIAVHDSGLAFGPGWFPPERFPDGEVFRWADTDSTIDLSLPSGERVLRLELEPGPGMGQQPMELHITAGDQDFLRAEIPGRSQIRIPFSRLGPNQRQLRLQAVGGGAGVAHDPRILAFRVFSCAWENSGSGGVTRVTTARAPVGLHKHIVQFWNRLQTFVNRLASSDSYMTITVPVARPVQRAAAFYVGWGGITGMTLNAAGYVLRRLGLRTKARSFRPAEVQPAAEKVEYLHTNACGDFTLAARDRWLDLRAYPEFDLYSMNIDSVFCYAAHHGGAKEEFLPDPMRIYHIEHDVGSGWTPEGQAQLFARMAAKGIGFVSYPDLVGWAAQMRRLGCSFVFNLETWGLAEFDLPESCLRPATASIQPSVRCAGDSE